MINAVIRGNQNTTKLINELKKAARQYPTLSKDEEEELIKTYAGNRDKLNNLLFMHNIRLVFNVAKKYMAKTDDFDSMVQDGMVGLAIAARNFDISRGVKFITYATPWVRKKVLERFYCKANEVLKRSVSLNAPASQSSSKINDNADGDLEGYVNEYLDPSSTEMTSLQHQLSANEQTKLCADLYTQLERDKSLTDKEKKIFTDLFYNKERAKDVQHMYGVTSKDIAQIKEKILRSMRDRLENHYGIHSFLDVYEV